MILNYCSLPPSIKSYQQHKIKTKQRLNHSNKQPILYTRLSERFLSVLKNKIKIKIELSNNKIYDKKHTAKGVRQGNNKNKYGKKTHTKVFKKMICKERFVEIKFFCVDYSATSTLINRNFNDFASTIGVVEPIRSYH